MPGLLGKKIGMTNYYSEDGKVTPVTAIEVGPCTVISIKTKKNDGYEALQLGFGEKKEKHLNKPQIENYKKLNLKPAAVLREFPTLYSEILKFRNSLKTAAGFKFNFL